MKIFIPLVAVILSSNPVWADVTLHYELQNADGKNTEMQISTHMIWAKIIESEANNTSLLFKAGHLFPLYKLNHSEHTYRNLNPEVTEHLRLDENKSNKSLFSYPDITLEPTRKQVVVSGIKCRLFHEIVDGETLIEHCFANSARAGLSVRDTRTLVRTYNMLRKHRDSGWLGAGSVDEEYISIRSRDLRNSESLLLSRISTKRLGFEELRIPEEYKSVSSADE